MNITLKEHAMGIKIALLNMNVSMQPVNIKIYLVQI